MNLSINRKYMICYIATYYQYDNYGSRLQNFALTEVLKEFDIEPITLYIKDEKKGLKKEFIKKIKALLSFLPLITHKQKVWKNEIKKNKAFLDFNTLLNLKKIDYSELDNLDFDDAIAIAGSDQIWSPMHFQNNERDIKLFFLQFVPKNKRFAYAPSFGVNEISTNLKQLYFDNLGNFKKISIREQAGKKIIKDLINRDVPIVPDPVFLLDKEQWRNKLGYKLKNKQSQKYILSYFLGKPDRIREKKVKEFAKKNNYKVVNIAGNYYKKKYFVPSPKEFIELIDNASIIFTDSFHATTFSIIMDKLFFVYKRNDVEQFSRIETLLEKYDCRSQYINNDTFYKVDSFLKSNIIYNKQKILLEKKIGISYIKSIIEERVRG